MDKLTKAERSENMKRIRARDTRPELLVRRLVFGLGYRYRVHYRRLPGTPDLAFVGRRKVIFVNGCFWHQHEGCSNCAQPKTRPEFWMAKLAANKERDIVVTRLLETLGYQVLVVWECETEDLRRVERRLKAFLASS
jgi:DNA mismatch endonuclease, patch repair protein